LIASPAHGLHTCRLSALQAGGFSVERLMNLLTALDRNGEGRHSPEI